MCRCNLTFLLNFFFVVFFAFIRDFFATHSWFFRNVRAAADRIARHTGRSLALQRAPPLNAAHARVPQLTCWLPRSEATLVLSFQHNFTLWHLHFSLCTLYFQFTFTLLVGFMRSWGFILLLLLLLLLVPLKSNQKCGVKIQNKKCIAAFIAISLDISCLLASWHLLLPPLLLLLFGFALFLLFSCFKSCDSAIKASVKLVISFINFECGAWWR